MNHIYAVLIGFSIDLFIGDPPWLIKYLSHPVIYIGKIIQKTEHFLHTSPSKGKKSDQLRGLFLLLFVTLIICSFTSLFILLCYKVHFAIGFIAETFLCYQILATKSLETESMKVYHSLQTENLDTSRTLLSYIVGRDTSHLEEKDIIKGTVETVAENTTDGVVAPLFYLFLGGIVGGIFYKSVNTLDSMVGYQNEKYRHFGTASAKMDDLLNFFPSRFTALIMVVSSHFLGYDSKQAWVIFKRDRFCHKSPNSAQTESVVAGALNIELAGNAYYFGELYEKKTIGDPIRPVVPEDIKRVNHIMKVTSILSCCIFLFFFLLTRI